MSLKQFEKSDVMIHILVLVFICIGLLMVFSSSAIMAEKRFGDPFFFLKRQFMWAVIGLFALIAARYINYNIWQKFSVVFLAVSTIMLILVLIPGIGVSVGGARRWLRFSFIGLQPSEFAKFALIAYTASWLDRKQSKIKQTVILYIPKILMFLAILLLIYKEPDLGTTVLIFMIVVSMHFVGGLDIKYLIALFISSIPVLYVAIFSTAYRRRRILTFLDPWKDPQGSGYQIIQSLLALGSGGIMGVGIGASRSKLLYLPDAHTDFIFPIIAEEMGMWGAIAVILLFAMFFWRGVVISLRANDFFGRMLGFGITISIVYQAIINIAVAIALMPTKGMPLPFISFGGSSLVMAMFSVGVLLNISSNYSKRKKA
ncbi:MAG: putative lipid II flippase FtsW [Elusimicrobiota bacterium]